MNGLVCKAGGAKKITIMDVSQDRLDMLKNEIKLPFDNFVNSAEVDPVQWAMDNTGGRGVDAVVVAASVNLWLPWDLRCWEKAATFQFSPVCPSPIRSFR